MRHFRTPEFKARLAALPPQIQDLAAKQYKLLKSDPRHPSLRFIQLKGSNRWSVRIGLRYRAVAERADDDIFVWFWIGPHEDYDKLID